MATIFRKDKGNLRKSRGENNRYSPHIRIHHLDGGSLITERRAGNKNVDAEVARRIWEGLSEEEFEKLRASGMPAWMASATDRYGRDPTGSGAKIVSECCLTGTKTTQIRQGGKLSRWLYGGEGGIRTLDTVLPYTHFPGVLLQPLGHLSGRFTPQIQMNVSATGVLSLFAFSRFLAGNKRSRINQTRIRCKCRKRNRT